MHYLYDHGSVEVCQIPCLSDNYGYLVHDKQSGKCAAIDTPDAKSIYSVTEALGWSLTDIWNTHWHMDHTGGNAALKHLSQCHITGPKDENGRIPEADSLVQDGHHLSLGETPAVVIATPGHTLGHIIYYLPEAGIAFVGDTLFTLGCGRLFEGTAEQMWSSLVKIRNLPDPTSIYCAHEYTLANAAFAISIDTDNEALHQRHTHFLNLRKSDLPTVPTTIEEEKQTNPFLRADQDSVMANLSMQNAAPSAVFAEIRKRKDHF